jgi:hypothetical protein
MGLVRASGIARRLKVAHEALTACWRWWRAGRIASLTIAERCVQLAQRTARLAPRGVCERRAVEPCRWPVRATTCVAQRRPAGRVSGSSRAALLCRANPAAELIARTLVQLSLRAARSSARGRKRRRPANPIEYSGSAARSRASWCLCCGSCVSYRGQVVLSGSPACPDAAGDAPSSLFSRGSASVRERLVIRSLSLDVA